jgi:putative peptide zinc metalloprotease protein
LELVLPDHRRIALADEHTIGRSPESTVRLADPSVSRLHARIRPDGEGALLSDAGSTYGTFLDGRRVRGTARLRAGSLIRVGDQELAVDHARGADEAGATVVVASVPTTAAAPYPRLRSGYALKRLAASEGERRWMLKDLRSGAFMRLSVADAELLSLLDGSRSLAELVSEAARRQGDDGPPRLALLLAGLGERGLISGVPAAAGPPPARGWRRVLTPRTFAWAGAGAVFARLHAAGGRLLLTRVGLTGLAAIGLAGLVAFVVLVVGRYGTPFVVASKVGLGGVVFVVGRLLVAAVHETAHGLVMASFGRPVREAGLKFVLVFPYAYVDTSDAWFEPRRRRVAVSAAGPGSDLVLGGAFALACLGAAAGPLRDVLFQLACGAYLGAFFNLNPLVPRDGYQIALDVLSPRGLRRARVAWALGGVALAGALFAHWVL